MEIQPTGTKVGSEDKRESTTVQNECANNYGFGSANSPLKTMTCAAMSRRLEMLGMMFLRDNRKPGGRLCTRIRANERHFFEQLINVASRTKMNEAASIDCNQDFVCGL